MRPAALRVLALAAAIGAVAACDSRVPTVGRIGGGADVDRPTVVVDSPATGSLINVGDSVFVRVRLRDDIALRSVELIGLSEVGDRDLGTFQRLPRYAPVVVTLPPGTTDTIIRRYIKPISAADTTPDSLVILAIALDSAGKADTGRAVVQLVQGPRVTLVSPTPNDSIPAGVAIGITARAVHPDGISSIDLRVRSETSWPTTVDTVITIPVTGAPREATVTGAVRIPVNAPIRGRLTVTATAQNVSRQTGSSGPVIVFVRSPNTAQPRVQQVVAPRTEIGDSLEIIATGNGIVAIGYVARDSLGTVVRRDSVQLPQPYTGNVRRSLALDLGASQQGKRLTITAFAVDESNRTGYAVAASQLTPASSLANARSDSTLVVYGRTYRIPRASTTSLIGDIAVDAARGNVFLSNLDFNRLEIWQSFNQQFDALGVAVGSQPWGLALSNDPTELLVANSGGTNVSRVFIASTNPRNIREDLGRRIRTRSNFMYKVTEVRDENSARITLGLSEPTMYSDRPQYIGQLQNGMIFFSTKPTPAAPPGTVRYLDPTQPFPDMRAVVFGNQLTSGTSFLVVDADLVQVRPALATTNLPDTIIVWDHRPGTNEAPISRRSAVGIQAALDSLRIAIGSDAYAIPNFEPTGLTDTTFVAVSGDRQWIAFGSGNVFPSKITMAGFFGTSPRLAELDLRNNASDRIFGLALDATGLTVAARGNEAFYASVDDPFHLRLQGKYRSFATGAGIAFHPSANGVTSSDATRLSFVASDDRSIEIVDIAYYISRGRLDIKSQLYGPLRAVPRMPGDPADVVLKLVGVSRDGLVVIDLRAEDIRPVP